LWWIPSKREPFGVKSFYNVMDCHDGFHFPRKSVWRTKVPFRVAFFLCEIYGPNSSHQTGSIREGCLLLINMPKILSTSNVRLFLNTLPHVQVSIFHGPCHEVSSVGPICHVVGSDTMKKFVVLTYLIKPVL
jgi:hypothetical protein